MIQERWPVALPPEIRIAGIPRIADGEGIIATRYLTRQTLDKKYVNHILIRNGIKRTMPMLVESAEEWTYEETWAQICRVPFHQLAESKKATSHIYTIWPSNREAVRPIEIGLDINNMYVVGPKIGGWLDRGPRRRRGSRTGHPWNCPRVITLQPAVTAHPWNCPRVISLFEHYRNKPVPRLPALPDILD
jgi:hypothetical protein